MEIALLNPIPFGKYWLLERISVGGMAEIFKAKTFGVQGFEKTIAIKRILPNMAEDKEFIAMFVDEAKLAVQLNHPNICQIYELGRNNDSHYIAMEFIHGKDLLRIQSRLRREGRLLPLEMSIYTIARILSALDYAHRKQDPRLGPLNLVHRDISPQNIIISYEGDVKLIDFGIAKATSRSTRTQVGVLKGKFGYMSPEQVNGQDIDRRSDIFSVGTVLAEMLTGKRLFAAESDYATLEKIRRAEYEPLSSLNPEIDSELEKILAKALVADRNNRYAWAHEFQEDLERYLTERRLSFSQSKTASWMKDNFVDDLAREKELLEKQHQLLEEGIREAGARQQQQQQGISLPMGEYQDTEGQTIVSASPLAPPAPGTGVPGAPSTESQAWGGGQGQQGVPDNMAPYPYGGSPGSIPGSNMAGGYPGSSQGLYGAGDGGGYQQPGYNQPVGQPGQFGQQPAPSWAAPQGDSQPTAPPPWAAGAPYSQGTPYGQAGPGAAPPPAWATTPAPQGQYGLPQQQTGGYQPSPYGMPQQPVGQPMQGQVQGQGPFGQTDFVAPVSAGAPQGQGEDPVTLPLSMPVAGQQGTGTIGAPVTENQGLPAFALSDQLPAGQASDADETDGHDEDHEDGEVYEEEETSILRTIMVVLILLLIAGGLAGGGYWLYMAKFKQPVQPAGITANAVGQLELAITPQSGFQAFLNDRLIGDTSPISVYITEGKGSLTIKAPGYVTYQENLVPQAATPQQGAAATAKSNAAGAGDGNGESPAALSGAFNAKLVKEITLAVEDKMAQVSMSVFPEPDKPFKVTVSMKDGNGEAVHESTTQPFSLAPGTYDFTVERDGMAPKSFQTQLEAGQIYRRYTNLTATSANDQAGTGGDLAGGGSTAGVEAQGQTQGQTQGEGTITIFAGMNVTAKVIVDGVETGVLTPVHSINPLKLQAGQHTVRLVDGRRIVEQLVELTPGVHPPIITSF